MLYYNERYTHARVIVMEEQYINTEYLLSVSGVSVKVLSVFSGIATLWTSII